VETNTENHRKVTEWGGRRSMNRGTGGGKFRRDMEKSGGRPSERLSRKKYPSGVLL